MKKIIYFLSFIALTIFSACETDLQMGLIDLEKGSEVAVENFTAKWSVDAYVDTAHVYGPFNIITLQDFNDSDSITVKDSEIKFWKFQAKASANNFNGTFETELSNCEVSEDAIGIKIFNGQIINSDSIYFEIQFEDDVNPYGRTYKLKGRRA